MQMVRNVSAPTWWKPKSTSDIPPIKTQLFNATKELWYPVYMQPRFSHTFKFYNNLQIAIQYIYRNHFSWLSSDLIVHLFIFMLLRRAAVLVTGSPSTNGTRCYECIHSSPVISTHVTTHFLMYLFLDFPSIMDQLTPNCSSIDGSSSIYIPLLPSDLKQRSPIYDCTLTLSDHGYTILSGSIHFLSK